MKQLYPDMGVVVNMNFIYIYRSRVGNIKSNSRSGQLVLCRGLP